MDGPRCWKAQSQGREPLGPILLGGEDAADASDYEAELAWVHLGQGGIVGVLGIRPQPNGSSLLDQRMGDRPARVPHDVDVEPFDADLADGEAQLLTTDWHSWQVRSYCSGWPMVNGLVTQPVLDVVLAVSDVATDLEVRGPTAEVAPLGKRRRWYGEAIGEFGGRQEDIHGLAWRSTAVAR